MSRFLLIVAFISIVAGCNNKKDVSVFDEILSQPPYSALTDSIKKSPGNDELYFRRAVLLNTNNLPEPALADFKTAWSIKKDERYAYGLGNLMLDKKPDSAILFLQEALAELPKSFLLQLTLARSYDARGKTDEALALCTTILQELPQQVDVLKMKAELLDKKGNITESIATLEKAYALTPFDVELNYMLALKLAETKNSRVLMLCDSLNRADSSGKHAEPSYYKGIYYSNINDKAKAISLFDNAIKLDYTFVDAYIEKGSIQFEQKKYTDAMKTFELAKSISNSFPPAYYWIGKSQEALGQKAEAKLNYERAFSLDNGFTEAKEAADKLK